MANGLTLNCCNRMLSSFLHKENASNKAVQITLVAIAIIGVSLFAASYYPVINATLGYYAIGIAAISLVSLIIFRSYSSSELDRAIDACKSFSEIEEIFKKSTTKVSLFGVRQLTADGIRGSSTLDHLAIKLEKEIATHLKSTTEVAPKRKYVANVFVYEDAEEEKSGSTVVECISDLFDKSEKTINTGNIFTRICYWIPRFFKGFICYNDIRNRYDGNSGGMKGKIGFYRNESYVNTEYDGMPPKFGTID